MSKETRSMLLRLSPDEMNVLTMKAKAAGLPRETFCRHILNGATIKAAPPADYYKLILELRRVGSNINQVLTKANTLGFLDVPLLYKALEDNHAAEQMLWDVFRNEETD